MADSVWTLPPMARGRPLAADSGIAPALPMMQTAHSRDRSGTVELVLFLPAHKLPMRFSVAASTAAVTGSKGIAHHLIVALP